MLKIPIYKEEISHGIDTKNTVQKNVIRQNPKYTTCQLHIYCMGSKVYNSLPSSIKTKPKK